MVNLSRYDARFLESALISAERAGDLEAAQVIAQALAPKMAEAQDTSPLESVLIGAGRTGDKLVSGVRKLWNTATGDDEELAAIKRDQAERDKAYAALQIENPKSTFAGEMLPYFAIPTGAGGAAGMRAAAGGAKVAKGLGARNVAAGLLKAGRGLKASKYADAAITGGLLGGAYYNDDQGLSAGTGALGGLLGQAAGSAAAVAAKPIRSRLHGASERVANWARSKGFKLTPGQKTGSRSAMQWEQSASEMAPLAGPFQDMAEHNAKKANRIALDAMGEIGEQLDDVALGKADKRLSNRFEELTRGESINVDNFFDAVEARISDTVDSLDDVANWAAKQAENNPVRKAAQDFLNRLREGSTISGEAYQLLQSRFNKAATAAFKRGDGETGHVLAAMKNALDDLVEKSLGKDKLKAFQKVRAQWKTKIALEAPGVIREGNVSLPFLHNVLKRTDKRGYLRGGNRSDFYEMARFGDYFKPLSSSNTAKHSFMQNLVTQGALLGGLGGGLGGASGLWDQGGFDPGRALAGFAGGLGTAAAIYSPMHLGAKAYLNTGWPFTGPIPLLGNALSKASSRAGAPIGIGTALSQ